MGIARRLVKLLIEKARMEGAARLYVSSVPSESAVGFYQSQGFRLTPDPDPDLYRLEPDDIHMVRNL
jgi:GNAT superfamily N-acetyltransferase